MTETEPVSLWRLLAFWLFCAVLTVLTMRYGCRTTW